MAQINFPEMEKQILDFWEKNKVFQNTLDKDSPQGEFVFYEGPPTANGRPGIHHVLARAFKDLLPRYKTMRGFHVRRKAGWDTHGLPVELQVEKEMGISGKPDIENLRASQAESIKYFNETCRKSVWQYKEDWEKMTERMGFWIDMKDPYVTYDNDYIETLWWIVKQVQEKGLLYQGHKVVPHCPRCGTALSSHEVAQGYKEVPDQSVYIKFKVKKGQGPVKSGDFILSWTTTPWTLPGNVALAVGDDFDYVIVSVLDPDSKKEQRYILAKKCLPVLGNDNYQILQEVKGSELVGIEYQPLFPGAIPEIAENFQNAFKVYPADFVTTEDGTGVVHTAVMYGEDDYLLGEKVSLPKHHTVSDEGKFIFEKGKGILAEIQGLPVKHKNKETEFITTNKIIDFLKKEKLLFSQETYTHDYPFCWRCDTPLLYYAKDSWFIRMSALRKELKDNNEHINWVPAHIKEGRFGEWLDGVKDWAISRERFWGTPLPVWQCTNSQCTEIKVIGSRQELEELSNQQLEDLHRPYVDEITFPCSHCQSEMGRDEAVLDCWFDSGSMPFAQLHYPFANKELIDDKKWYPADFICEAIDQTRGWFYTLLAIATLLDKGTPYKNVICLGHINDQQGKKMSKRLGNIVDPWQIMEKYGADALRFHMYTVNQPGEPKNFNPADVEVVLKKNWLILWNVLSFYQMYSSNVSETEAILSPNNILDKWILVKNKELASSVSSLLDNYDITSAARLLSGFIEELSTWYIRRSRDRFKADNKTSEEAVITLRAVLINLSKLLAPFAPFISEKLYQEINSPGKDSQGQSVHMQDWPKIGELMPEEKDLLEKMEKTRSLVAQGLALRAENKIKIRQPLSTFYVTEKEFSPEFTNILKQELNVKTVKYQAKKTELDTSLNQELLEEGLVREIVRTANNLRKKAGLQPMDKIKLHLKSEDSIERDFFHKYSETLLQATASQEIVENMDQAQQSVSVGNKAGNISVGISKI